MYAFLVTLLIIDALLLSVVVLLQAGQGGGLASLGGGTTDMVMGGRQAVTLLTTSTKWLGGIFMGLALMLSFVAANRTTAMTDVQRQLQQQQQQVPGTQPSPLTDIVVPQAAPDTN
jgi:preprotein translocase subunit SecG